MILCKYKPEQTWISYTVSDKAAFKEESISKDKKGHFIQKEVSLVRYNHLKTLSS